eukprot:GEMP01028653.1.p1 GENE.GEMP01028653.1~~GEMP01028653.1.p1  ORF type:complete len:142 (+),score=17.16 GEMP01028653.1:194-619(+)
MDVEVSPINAFRAQDSSVGGGSQVPGSPMRGSPMGILRKEGATLSCSLNTFGAKGDQPSSPPRMDCRGQPIIKRDESGGKTRHSISWPDEIPRNVQEGEPCDVVIESTSTIGAIAQVLHVESYKAYNREFEYQPGCNCSIL